MRIRSKLVIALVAVLVVVASSGCSADSNGTTRKSAGILVRQWTDQILADIGTGTVLAHSTTPVVYNSCGDWTTRYELMSLTVTVPFYKLQSAAKAVIDGERTRGWDTSAAHINVGQAGNLNGGTIRPPHAGSDAAMIITGGPSSSNADLQITITSDCFVR